MTTPTQDPLATATRGPLRWLLVGVGSLLTALAALGAFLPVLPTTPFLLLAGACFARSSPRFHARLKRAPLFGVYVEQWERDHSIPAHAKRKAYGLIALAFGMSIWAVDSNGLRVLLVAIGLALAVFLAKLPTTSVASGDVEDTAGAAGADDNCDGAEVRRANANSSRDDGNASRADEPPLRP